MYQFIKNDTLHAGETKEQMYSIKISKKAGEKLANNKQDELKSLYDKEKNEREIAEIMSEEINKLGLQNKKQIQTAIYHALNILGKKGIIEKRDKSINNSIQMKKYAQKIGTKYYKKMSKKGQKALNEKYTPEERYKMRSEGSKKGLLNAGKYPLSDDEIMELIILREEGKTYPEIAKQLNNRYHNGEEKINHKNLSSSYRHHKKKFL